MSEQVVREAIQSMMGWYEQGANEKEQREVDIVRTWLDTLGAHATATSEPVVVFAPDTPEHKAIVSALIDTISNMSEEAYCAGWMIDCEYAIWAEMQTGETGMFISDAADIAKLRSLSGMVDGWVMWSDDSGGAVYVPLNDWYVAYSAWFKRQRPSAQDGKVASAS